MTKRLLYVCAGPGLCYTRFDTGSVGGHFIDIKFNRLCFHCGRRLMAGGGGGIADDKEK